MSVLVQVDQARMDRAGSTVGRGHGQMRQGCWGLHAMGKVSTGVSLSSVDVADGQVMVRVRTDQRRTAV